MIILRADYIDEVLEGVDKKNWADIVNHYIKNPKEDNPAVINRLFDRYYVDDETTLKAWNSLDLEIFSDRNYRYELWKSLNNKNKKKLIKAFSSDKNSEAANIKEIWDSLGGKQSFERQKERNKLLSITDKNQKESLMKKITKKETLLPDDKGLEVTYNENENEELLEINLENKKHIIPISSLPSEVKKIKIRKYEDGNYYTYYHFDDKEEEKRIILNAGNYLQERIQSGYDGKAEMYVEGHKDKPIINFGTSKEAVFKISKDKIELWDSEADITGKKARVLVGNEMIFSHPKILTKDQKYSYASYEKLAEDNFKIRGAGRTLKNDGLGFYFENEGILDLNGKYEDKENKPILKFYKNRNENVISGQTPSVNSPVSFTLGSNANLILGENKIAIQSKDEANKYYQYAIIGERVSLNNPIKEYVPRLTPIRYLTENGERVSNGENKIPTKVGDERKNLEEQNPPFSATTKSTKTTNSPYLLPLSSCQDGNCPH